MGEKSVLRSLSAFAGKGVKARNLIIVSDDKVVNYNLSRRAQFIAMGASLVCICWIAFSTGSFIAARNALKQRDMQAYSATMDNIKMQHEFALVKRDLSRLGDDKTGSYAKFILKQYNDKDVAKTSDASSAEGAVMQRIAYLEKELVKMQKSNDELVAKIRERAEGKIADIDQIIASTGLSRDRMLAQNGSHKKPLRKLNGEDNSGGAAQNEVATPEENDIADGEGGPYVPEDKVSAEAHEKEMFSSLDALVKASELANSLPLSMPLPGARFMSGFGHRIDPFTHRSAIHEGLDLAGPVGAKIMATNDGKISFSGRAAGYGNLVEIDHGNGISTRYGHLSRILVEEGQEVKKGQIIGVQGSTGRSTGAHLHYEVRFNDEPINPANFLKGGKNVLSLRQ